MRNTGGYQANSGIPNRVRREGAVMGSMNAHNNSNGFVRNNSGRSVGNNSRGRAFSNYKPGPGSDRSGSNKSDNSAKRIEPRKNLMSVA